MDTTGSSRALLVAPRAGYLKAAYFLIEDTLAAHDTNYVTFAVTNRLGSGSGSTAMLAAANANTTKATGGSAWTAKSPRSATLHGTAANLRVAAGDCIEVTITVSGTLGGPLELPRVLLEFATVPAIWTPRIARTAGSPLVGPVEDTLAGELTCQLSGEDEANVAGIDFGDRLCLQGNKQPFFETRVKISGKAANTRFVFGLASAYNAVFNDIAKSAWFRVEGDSLNLYIEADDGTNETTLQDTGIDLAADTYVKLGIVLTDLRKAAFFVNDAEIGGAAVSLAALSTSMLQPVLYVQKDTEASTGTESFTVDFIRWGCNRR